MTETQRIEEDSQQNNTLYDTSFLNASAQCLGAGGFGMTSCNEVFSHFLRPFS